MIYCYNTNDRQDPNFIANKPYAVIASLKQGKYYVGEPDALGKLHICWADPQLGWEFFDSSVDEEITAMMKMVWPNQFKMECSDDQT